MKRTHPFRPQRWPWEDPSLGPMVLAHRRLEAFFELMTKLGFRFWCFHDRQEGRLSPLSPAALHSRRAAAAVRGPVKCWRAGACLIERRAGSAAMSVFLHIKSSGTPLSILVRKYFHNNAHTPKF